MSLHVVRPISEAHADTYLTRRELADRRARIDALAVDRSCVYKMPLQRWSDEAMAREPRLEADRQEVTLAQKMAAWRGLAR